jgi:hypothetical protein
VFPFGGTVRKKNFTIENAAHSATYVNANHVVNLTDKILFADVGAGESNNQTVVLS